MQISKKLTALKKAVFRDATNVQVHNVQVHNVQVHNVPVHKFIIPTIEVVFVDDASLEVKPSKKLSRPVPIYFPPGTVSGFISDDSERSPSPTDSYESSVFSQTNASTSTGLTADSPEAAPCVSLEQDAIGSWFDADCSSSDSLASESDPEFEEFLKNAQEAVEREITAFKAARRKAVWDSVQAATPPKMGFTVVIPDCPKMFRLGNGMMFADSHATLLRWLATESKMKPSSGEGMVLVSKTYPHEITDRISYGEWVKWVKGREAEDRVLWAM